MTDHIPAEAVEAGVDAVSALQWADGEHVVKISRGILRERVVRAAIEAALPYLRPEPSEDHDPLHFGVEHDHPDYGRGVFFSPDAVEAFAAGFTRRPMPSRGQVAEWYLANSQYDGPLVPRKLSMAAYDFADAVLALFEKGAEG